MGIDQWWNEQAVIRATYPLWNSLCNNCADHFGRQTFWTLKHEKTKRIMLMSYNLSTIVSILQFRKFNKLK